MQEITPKAGKNKTGKRPYMRLFTSDYRDGTLHLSFELQGFYFRILTYLHDGESVPADPVALARFIHCNVRTSRALLPRLIASGKLYVDGDWIRNKRVDRDLNLISDRDDADIEPISNSYQPDIAPISVREIEKAESNQCPENPLHRAGQSHSQFHIQKEELVAAAELEPARPSPEPKAALKPLDELYNRLIDAGGKALADPVNAQGLLQLSFPLMWIERGCDLEKDILPTIRAKAKTHKGKPIKAWNYFTEAVVEAMVARTSPLPVVSVQTRRPVRGSLFGASRW